MAPRCVLLRLSDSGEPLNTNNATNGVLLLPALALDKTHGTNEPLFTLRIVLNAAAEVSRNGVIQTNVPPDSETPFKRDAVYNFPLSNSFHEDISVDIPIYKPGPYSFSICYESSEKEPAQTKDVYFNVPPQLLKNSHYIPFNSVNIQTVVSKWIGPLNQWDKFFAYVAHKGYNMIHFTPLQERGLSNSPYSIYDQLKFDPELFNSNEEAVSTIKKVIAENGLLSMTDVVFNHTANNSSWIRDCPDAGYNAETAPHLQAAIALDQALADFSDSLEDLGLPTELTSEADLDQIMQGIKKHVLEPLKLWEFYVYEKTELNQKMQELFENNSVCPAEIPDSVDVSSSRQLADFVLKHSSVDGQPRLEGRFSNKLDPSKFLSILLALKVNAGSLFEEVSNQASRIVDEINSKLYSEYDDDVSSINNQLKDRIRYLRLAGNGPKLGRVTPENKIAEAYFTRFEDKDGKTWALANNGWIWGGDPLVDFASKKSKAYLRREVIVWSDCIKLRYGSCPEDSPNLWKRMIQYTQECAKIFDGFRLDNCHSTPLHVGEALLDAARLVNPNIYIIAELFTGSEDMDKIFVERLGINSLIREAMQAWSVEELSRLVHKHGGRPIGSLSWLPLDEFAYPASEEPKGGGAAGSNSELEIPQVITAQAPHALFMDCTHDNQTPAQTRTVEDTLPTAALVAFCSSAIGSVFGYDETYPELLDVVGETRQYSYDKNEGILEAKLKLHDVRKTLADESEDAYTEQEMYVHHEGQYITVQRYNTRTGQGWFLIARTKFSEHYDDQELSPVELQGAEIKYEFGYTLEKKGKYAFDEHKITGIPTALVEIESPDIISTDAGSTIKLSRSFAPGSIAVFSTKIAAANEKLDQFVKKGAIEASLDLNLYDLNAVLYRCEPEERDASQGKDGTYNIPNYGQLKYAGLEGWISVLKNVIWNNDLGHPLCDHLRQGMWAGDYVVNRLDKYAEDSKGISKFRDWLQTRMDAIRGVPYYLRPHYFALVVGIAYEAARFRALSQLEDNIKKGTSFVQSIALTSVQMCGYMNNTSLLPDKKVPSLAAGLPHFSNDYMRCWGRDVFISFRGLLIVPARFEDAKQHILGFAKTLKHGLIPNLLDAGRNPRYNARDAAWFFAQAVQEYVNNVPEGEKILDEEVSRRFPLDDTYISWDDDRAFSYKTSIRDILYEILLRHAKGISYREANAGPNLDLQMTDEGFNVEVFTDWKTGLIHGGSQWNCGTWMDKMGESERAGNKGVPGTPRDGAAVEIQGLLKSTLRFVNELNDQGLFGHTEVEKSDGSKISLKDWEELVQSNFERCFYVPTDANDDAKYEVNSNVVNRRGIYKDLFKSGKEFEDYQLRPNFAIAMCVAPELFSVDKAYDAVNNADKIIRGPVGMRTLDPSDWNYRPFYINSVDSEDFATSKGRNYHQGPEWVWCFGYFIRAFFQFHYKVECDGKLAPGEMSKPSIELLTALNSRIQGHIRWVKESPWAGLTELTNKDGVLCDDSSPTQAWSTSCLLDLYYDLWRTM